MNQIIQSLFDRKSVRAYTEEPVTAEEKELLFQAAFQAPTGGNQQHFTIIDVTDQGEKDLLAELCDHQPFIAKAPVVLVFCSDLQKNLDAYREAGIEPDPPTVCGALTTAINTAIVAQNVVVAAESLGLGSCYIGDILENCEKIRALFKLPTYVMPAAMLVIGRPTQQQLERKKPVRFPEKYMVCENEYKPLSGEELRDMYAERAGEKGFDAWLKSLYDRKYDSDFVKEMARSVDVWLEPYRRK